MRNPSLSLLTLALGLALAAGCGGGRSRSSGSRTNNNNNNNNQVLCGNGAADQGEVCDGSNLGGISCEALGFGAGVLACAADCRDFDRRGCGAPATCGNGARDGSELCDGADFGDRSCQTYGYTEGNLSCFPNCGALDTSGCSGQQARCGNGAREGAEVCDGADVTGATCEALGLGTGTVTCNSACNGLVTSGCSSTCTPDCSGRSCGPDPVCGSSCGTCSEGTCNGQGQCEVANAQAPRILSFATNVMSITRGQSVTFSAIVTDPDGIADVIGGTLEASSGAVYGTFSASGNDGAYSLSLSWTEMGQVLPINFATEEQRPFVARFYDVAGHQVTQTLQVRLHCNGMAACDGYCVDLATDYSNCGQCNRACQEPAACAEGHCVAALYWYPQEQGTCQQACATQQPGSTCTVACDFGQGTPAAAAAQFYCGEGACGVSYEWQVYSCTQVPPQNYSKPDGSVMYFDYGGCCCVTP